jgi:PAS domain S-box-containing protein
MRDVDAGERELTGETQALHSRITKLEQVSHNLPGHKNVDEELDRAWREWKSTFDAIKDSIILTDGEFKIIQANLASSQLFGRPLDQVIGKTCWQLVHGTNEAPEGCPLKRAKDTKKHEEMEVYLPQKGIWAADSVDPVLDEQGRLTGVVHIIRDITDRKQAEELLRKERDRTQKYLDVAGTMLVAVDAEQRVGLINKKGCEILGYSEEEVLAKNWFDNFLPEKVRGQVRAVFEKIVSGEFDSLEYYENHILTKNGDQRLIAWHNTMLRDDKGQFIATLSSGEDITERKKMDEVLRESEEKYRGFVENSPNLVAIYQEGALKYVNQIMCEKLGWTFQEMTSPSFNPVEKIIPQRFQSLVKENITKRLRRENISPYEVSMKTRDGSEIPVMVMAQRILYYGKPADEVIHIDITERRKAEQKLLEDQAQLKSLASQLTLAEERERHHLANELHDQISQALVVSKIKLDALRKSRHSRELDKALEDVCNSIGQTIQDTRTLTLDLGNPVLHELGFEAAVSEWLTDRIQKKHGITVEFEDDGEDKPLDDDIRTLLFRNVRELLTNVVKHASAHKVKISIRKVGSEIHISVEDDGWGFDTKKVAATAVREGGFGLFSIRERLGQLGGHLEIESEPGCGCKVTMTAPLKRKEITDGRNNTTR